MCKHGNVFSLAVLIGRGLDHNPSWFKIALSSPIVTLASPFIQFSGYMKPTGYTNVYPVFCYIENDGTFKMRFCPKYNNKEIGAARKIH